MTLKVVNEDITKLEVDAIVNAANTSLLMGGGVCGAIFKAAGIDKLSQACEKLAPINTAEAVLTPGFNLNAKYIIHTAGPVYDPNDKNNSRGLLKKSYENSLKLAVENDIKSIAFPLISAGIYGYPKLEAYNIAKSTINNCLEANDIEVNLSIVDKDLLDLIDVE